MCGFGSGFWAEEIGVMGHAAGPEFKAQMDLDTLVPYKNYFITVNSNFIFLLVLFDGMRIVGE